MKVLVIDDGQNNQGAAKAQLSNHEIVVVGSYNEGQKLVKEKHDFEVVLVDLLIPASGQSIGLDNRHLVGEEMPVGIFLGLLAAVNGAKFVAVFTDTDHHSHPASACFDAFNRNGENEPSPFRVEEAKMLLSNTRNWVNHFRPENLAEEMPFDQ